MPESANPYVKLSFTPDTGLGFILDTMEATEELGRPFSILLDVSSEKPKGDLHAILGGSATVSLTYPQKPVRHFNGIVARIHYRGLTGGGYKYQIELRPWIWLLSHKQDCRIFSGKSPWEIITTIFREAGFTDFADKRQNGAGGTALDYCVQYRESSLDFVTRLMEQYGLYYYVTHKQGAHTVNVADDPGSHPSVGKALPYRYNQTDRRAAVDHVWEWSAEARIQPGAYVLRDYNFTTPKADLTAKSLIAGKHTHGSSEVYDYPGQYLAAGEGKSLADVQMQGYDARRQIYAGTSNSRALGTGMRFTLSDFPDSTANQEYLVISSVCTIDREETRAFQTGEEMIDTFRCALQAVPGSRPFRLAPLTPKPLIRGPQTARVAGEKGQEITTDQYGRIKVKFPWDRSAGEDQNSSCWIRVAQSWAGQGFGAMFIPRIGQEVVVEFLEGDPDRPLVTGQVYNADMTVPYGLPANKTRSTIKSNSSLKGGGFNEFRFEDKKGSEEVFFQAQKDFNENILNDHTAIIGNDTTTTVKGGNRVVTVKAGNDTHGVESGNRTSTIKGDEKVTVTSGNREVTVSAGNDTHNVDAGNRTSTVKGNEKVTVTSGNREVTVSAGNDTLTVSAGNHTITVSAGSSTIDAAQKILLKVGPSSVEITPAGITIKAPDIKVEGIASLTASAGKVEISGDMMAELSAPITKVEAVALLDLSASAIAKLSGAMVKIN